MTNATTTNTVNDLGTLRSDIKVTLHTQYATRIWTGRPLSTATDNGRTLAQIISMPHCLSILNQINQDAASDNPYADQYLIGLEEKIKEARKQMKALENEIYDIYAEQIPEGIDIERCQNISPVSMPLYVKYPIGYLLIYLLTDYDSVARVILTASHIAIMTKQDAKAYMNRASHIIRSIFGLAQRYRNAGVTRIDFQQNNARAQSAVKRFGELPQDILDATRRSGYAPEISSSIIQAEETETETEMELLDDVPSNENNQNVVS